MWDTAGVEPGGEAEKGLEPSPSPGHCLRPLGLPLQLQERQGQLAGHTPLPGQDRGAKEVRPSRLLQGQAAATLQLCLSGGHDLGRPCRALPCLVLPWYSLAWPHP